MIMHIVTIIMHIQTEQKANMGAVDVNISPIRTLVEEFNVRRANRLALSINNYYVANVPI